MANEKKIKDGYINIEIATILSNRTKLGMVQFEIEDGEHNIKTQWDIAKAKEIHSMLGQAIEAAISDTLIYKFMVEKVGVSDEKASMILMDFRELRQGSLDTVYPT